MLSRSSGLQLGNCVREKAHDDMSMPVMLHSVGQSTHMQLPTMSKSLPAT